LGHPSYVWRFGQDRRLALIHCFAPSYQSMDPGTSAAELYLRSQIGEYSPHAFGIDVELDRVLEGAKTLRVCWSPKSENLPLGRVFDVVVF